MMKKEKIGECRYCGSRQWVINHVCERCQEELKADRESDPLWAVLWMMLFMVIGVGVVLYAVFYIVRYYIMGI